MKEYAERIVPVNWIKAECYVRDSVGQRWMKVKKVTESIDTLEVLYENGECSTFTLPSETWLTVLIPT